MIKGGLSVVSGGFMQEILFTEEKNQFSQSFSPSYTIRQTIWKVALMD
ncbi:MAG: hypothetical protein ABIR06_14550 [Cyclobacteriaceae bacterium]